jgi:hypothetical protein
MELLFNCVVAFAVAFLVKYFESKDYFVNILPLRGNVAAASFAKTLIIALIAGLAIFGTYLRDKAFRYLNQPEVNVTTTVDPVDNSLSIRMSLKSGSIQSLSVEYPVPGTITQFMDTTTSREARAVAYAIPSVVLAAPDRTPEVVSEDLDLSLRDVRMDLPLTYKVYYQTHSFPGKGTNDRFWSFTDEKQIHLFSQQYILSYTWEYKGSTYQESEVRQIKDDSPMMRNSRKIKASEIPKLGALQLYLGKEGADAESKIKGGRLLMKKRPIQ